MVGVITPWNYALLMAALKIAPILGSGNTVILKPSEQTPLTTLKLAELTADVGPAGVLNTGAAVTNVPAGVGIARTEVSGPVVSIETFRNDDEAIQLANENIYELAASVWSANARSWG